MVCERNDRQYGLFGTAVLRVVTTRSTKTCRTNSAAETCAMTTRRPKKMMDGRSTANNGQQSRQLEISYGFLEIKRCNLHVVEAEKEHVASCCRRDRHCRPDQNNTRSSLPALEGEKIPRNVGARDNPSDSSPNRS
jgi:hypothetical protein